MIFQPIRSKRVYKEVLDQIQELIAQGQLSPGDRLMGEREMSLQLEVSRTSVREAIRTLEILGMVEIKPGDGTFLKDTKEDLITPLALALSIENIPLSEILQIRHMIEVESAGLAALNRTEEDLIVLKRLLEDLENRRIDEDMQILTDLKFHYQISQAGGNNLLSRLMRTFGEYMRQTIQEAMTKRFRNDERLRETCEEHRKLVEAIESMDPESAKALMRKHIYGVIEDLK